MRYHPTHINVMYFITFMDRSKYFGKFWSKGGIAKDPVPGVGKIPTFFRKTEMAGFHLWYHPDAQCDDIKVKITCKTKRSKERRHQNPGSANDGQLHQQLSDPEHLHNFFNHSLICELGSLLQHFLSKVLTIHEFITREARREATKEVRRSKIEGRSSRSKKGAAERERSVSSSARNSGEVKKAEELEKRPLADILVYVLFSSLNCCFDQILGEWLFFN